MTDKDNDELREAIGKAAESIGAEIMSETELAAFMEAGEQQIAAHDDRAKEEGRRFLTEENDQELIETWWAEATACKRIDDAADFARRLISDYRHDYGTICHAIAAAGVAMASAVEQSPEGGVTGFQAGAIGWMLHKRWEQWGDEPRKIVDLSHLLYPQYDEHWTTIHASTAEWLQKRATELLAQHPDAAGSVSDRWRDIAAGRFPAFITVEPA